MGTGTVTVIPKVNQVMGMGMDMDMAQVNQTMDMVMKLVQQASKEGKRLDGVNSANSRIDKAMALEP